MERISVEVPIWENFSRAAGWERVPKNRSRFWAVRWHLVLVQSQLNERPLIGERLGGIEAPVNSGGKLVYAKSHEVLDMATSLIRSSKESSYIRNTSVAIGQEISLNPIGQVSGELRQEIKRTITQSFVKEFQFSQSVRSTRGIESTFVYDSTGPKGPLVSVAKYQKMRGTLYLESIDYLQVDYSKGLGIRRRRSKYPEPHKNSIKIRKPLMAMEYWQEYDGIHWVAENDYQIEIDDPLDVRFIKHPKGSVPFLPRPTGYSLYRLSNAAFPLRWKKRDSPWSEPEINGIIDPDYNGGPETKWRWQSDE